MAAERPWTTAELTADLAGKLRADAWLVCAEVMLTNGQRADVLAMRRKLSVQPMLILEVKTSRADLLGDLRRDKWRGYLAEAAVAFAFPAGLAQPGEVPPEAGVMVRVGQGWSWRRAPRWSAAPAPGAYLYRRMALTASDQAAARVRAEMTPRAADLWSVARAKRQEHGRRLAEIANDVDTWRRIVADEQERFRELSARKRELEAEVRDLAPQRRLFA